MDFCYFIGIDIAKDTLDWAIYTQQGTQLSTDSLNTLAGIKSALAEFKALPGWNPKQAVFCMEHTAQAALRHLQRPFTRATLRVETRRLAGIILTNQAGGRDAAGQN